MNWGLRTIGRGIVRYLEQPARGYEPFLPGDPDVLRGLLWPGDILLVEGNSHLAGIIKYLTQSTWLHATLYVGPIKGKMTKGNAPSRVRPRPCHARQSSIRQYPPGAKGSTGR